MKTILIALGALALMPAAAHATTVSYAPDGALVVTAAPGERNNVSLQEDDGDAGKVVVYEGGTHSVTGSSASVKGPEPRKVQAEWLAARLEGKPMDSERWFVDLDGKISKTSLA